MKNVKLTCRYRCRSPGECRSLIALNSEGSAQIGWMLLIYLWSRGSHIRERRNLDNAGVPDRITARCTDVFFRQKARF